MYNGKSRNIVGNVLRKFFGMIKKRNTGNIDVWFKNINPRWDNIDKKEMGNNMKYKKIGKTFDEYIVGKKHIRFMFYGVLEK